MLRFLYPPKNKCILYGVKSPKALCGTCSSSIEFIHERQCLKCGKGLYDNYNTNICPDCLERSYSFHSAYSCFYYRGTGRDLIHKLKYEGMLDIASILAKFMAEAVYNESLKADIIVPVPIFESKLQKRGFNQAEVIGEHLSKHLCIPAWDCLIRTRDTKDQYGMKKLERRLNVLHAFSLNTRYNVANKRILLIDDIYTTGSTVDECSKELMSAQAKLVYVLTAASGVNT